MVHPAVGAEQSCGARWLAIRRVWLTVWRSAWLMAWLMVWRTMWLLMAMADGVADGMAAVRSMAWLMMHRSLMTLQRHTSPLFACDDLDIVAVWL